MKSLLVTAAITTFVLALFLHSGNALVCYECLDRNCDKNVTCTGQEDTCIIIHHSKGMLSSCWLNSVCNKIYFSHAIPLDNIKYRCCNTDLCNNAPNVVASKIVLSGALLLTIVHMLKSLVWN